MEPWQERTALLFGQEGLARLESASVLIVGVGGVGGAAAEMLARSSVGHIILVDADVVEASNINRQLPALHSTVGRGKCDTVAARIRDINPEAAVDIIPEYICEENIDALLGGFRPDFVVDAIDTLSPKIALIQWCLKNGLRLVSSMGSGAKTDATRVRLADISKTRECPLAHQLRKRLHRLGISSGFLAVYSEEKPDRDAVVLEEGRNKKSNVGTVSYLPAVFGCVCAQAVVCGIVK